MGIIAAVHSSWLKDFVSKYGSDEAKASYLKIVKSAIGDKNKSKKKLGNGQMIDMELKLSTGEIKPVVIQSMRGYDLQGTPDAATGAVPSVGARFESFGDEYYGEYYDEEYDEYYGDLFEDLFGDYDDEFEGDTD